MAALAFHDKQFVPSELANNLGLGDRLGDEISLNEIRGALDYYGIKAVGVKSDRLYDILKSDSKISLIAQTLNSEGAGHFIFVYTSGAGDISVYDYPRSPKVAREEALENLTGYALVIAANEHELARIGLLALEPDLDSREVPEEIVSSQVAATKPTQKLGARLKIDVGAREKVTDILVDHADFDSQKSKTSVEIVNASGKNLLVETIKGSCGCLSISKVGFPALIKPNENLQFDLTLDELKFNWRMGATVALSLDGGEVHLIRLIPNREVSLSEQDCLLVPSKIDLGYVSEKKIVFPVHLLMPVAMKDKFDGAIKIWSETNSDCAFEEVSRQVYVLNGKRVFQVNIEIAMNVEKVGFFNRNLLLTGFGESDAKNRINVLGYKM